MIHPVYKALLFAFLPIFLLACGVVSHFVPGSRSASSDGAPDRVLADCDIEIPIPRVEPKSRGGNPATYTVHGKTYRVLDSSAGFVERGIASWYGTAFHGNLTSNGERYDMYAMSAAHKHLPLPTYVEVKNLDNNRRVIVRVNDRGPFISGRVIDLSYAAATKIGMLDRGTARVEVRALDPATFDYAAWSGNQRCKPKTAAPTTVLYQSTVTEPVSQVIYPSTSAVSEEKGAQVARSDNAAQILRSDSEIDRSVYIQLATYSQQQIASLELARLESEMEAASFSYEVGLFPYYPSQNGLPWYRLRVGPLDSQQADALIVDPLFSRFGKIYTVRE